MDINNYDLVIVGGGAAGLVAQWQQAPLAPTALSLIVVPFFML